MQVYSVKNEKFKEIPKNVIIASITKDRNSCKKFYKKFNKKIANKDCYEFFFFKIFIILIEKNMNC